MRPCTSTFNSISDYAISFLFLNFYKRFTSSVYSFSLLLRFFLILSSFSLYFWVRKFAVMEHFHIPGMLDRYVYDYFLKRNLPGLAESFKNEANLEFDPEVPPAIDVPEGFLLEWWIMNYDYECFREWLNQNERPSLESTQEDNDSQSGQHLVHSEKNKQLLVDSASTMSTGSESLALHGRGKAPLLFSPSSHQEGPLTTTSAKCTPINYASTSGQKPEPLVCATPRTENLGSIEETDSKLENLVSTFWMFEDQKALQNKLALGENIAGSTSQALLADDNISETSDCTSKFHRLSTASDASTGRYLEIAIQTNEIQNVRSWEWRKFIDGNQSFDINITSILKTATNAIKKN